MMEVWNGQTRGMIPLLAPHNSASLAIARTVEVWLRAQVPGHPVSGVVHLRTHGGDGKPRKRNGDVCASDYGMHHQRQRVANKDFEGVCIPRSQRDRLLELMMDLVDVLVEQRRVQQPVRVVERNLHPLQVSDLRPPKHTARPGK